MKTKTLLYIVIILFILLLFLGGWTVYPHEQDTESIGSISSELNQQKQLYQTCLDNLTYLETVNQALWFTKPCGELTERIMVLEAKMDDLLYMEYEEAEGLIQSRQAQ